MADFRKWLLAFAVVAFLVVAGTPASAQIIITPNAFTCVANAGVPPIVRAEGITELVGDIVLQCSGGQSTPAGNPIPLSNVTIFLNTNVTSRIMSTATNASEALMLFDEPYPAPPGNAANVPNTAQTPPNSPTQLFCTVPLTACGQITGTGGGVGATGPYSGATGRPNIFQGQQVGANSVAWLGVPIDAPGTNNIRVIRFTNIRANACQLGVSSTLIPTQIVAFISVNGSQQVTINNPQQTVAFIQPGLVASVIGPGAFLQCNDLNRLLALGTGAPTVTPNFTVRALEGFASSFKGRSFQPPSGNANPLIVGQALPSLQNVPGFPYNTESGFVSAATGGAVAGGIGVADFGTRIMVRFNNIGAGVQLFAPAQLTLNLGTGTTPSGGLASLVTGTDNNGNGGSLSASANPFVAVSINGTSGVVVYEVTQSLPNAIENLRIPITVAFVSNTANNLPGIGTTTANVSFAPLSTVNTASSTAPIPRFCDSSSPLNVFRIDACTCDLLFPFVTNQAGFDTGVAIANTSLDPFGTTPQTGTTQIFYYGNTTGGGAAPAPQTSQTMPAGSELIFTLSGGGNFGIAATPGFQGYLITISKFQYCHAFAFISDVGAQKVAEGYVAIQLDVPALNRTGQFGENEGH